MMSDTRALDEEDEEEDDNAFRSQVTFVCSLKESVPQNPSGKRVDDADDDDSGGEA